MAGTIKSSATFPTSPQRLYQIFMDAKLHGAAIGSPARIDAKVGGKFTVFGGAIGGKTLHLVPGKLVVQTWRGNHWKASDPDSILIVRFSGTATRGKISLVHENVPGHDIQGVKSGWVEYYWKPWKAYLARAKSKVKKKAKR